MPIAHVSNIAAVAATPGGVTNQITITPSSTPAGALITVISRSSTAAGGTITGITDNQGNTYNLAKKFDATNGLTSEIWRSPNSTAGVTSITATYSVASHAAATVATLAGIVFSGVATSGELGQTAEGEGGETDTNIDLSVASFTPDTTDSVIVVAGGVSANGSGWTAGSGYTVGPSNNRIGGEYKIRTGSGNETAPFVANFGSSGPRNWSEVAAEFKAAAAAGGRIFKLAGEGGGLAGPARGLVA